MYALLFTIVFQGLAILAVLCLIAGAFKFLPNLLSPLRQLVTKLVSPVFAIVRAITPNIVPSHLHPILATFWLLTLRVGLYLSAGAYGILPQ